MDVLLCPTPLRFFEFCAIPDFSPKMVFGPNLHLIGPFEAFDVGFCTDFCCASFVCLSPGADFWTPGQNLGPPDQIWGFPGRHSGPGTFLGAPQKYFCEERIFW